MTQQRKPGDHLWNAPSEMVTYPSGAKKGLRITRYDLLPPEALAEIAACWGLSQQKYPSAAGNKENWELGLPLSAELRAIYTHLEKFRSGVDFDSDDGIHHLAHAAQLMMMIMASQARGIATDDRHECASPTE